MRPKFLLIFLVAIGVTVSVNHVSAATYVCEDLNGNVSATFSTFNCDNKCPSPKICSELTVVTPPKSGTGLGGNTGGTGSGLGGNTGGMGGTGSSGGSGAAGGTGGTAAQAPTSFEIPNPLSCDEANCLVNRIFTILWVIAFPLVTIMILFGAYQLMFSRGNPETVEAGRKTIQWAVIGFIVLVSARLIVAIIFATVGAVVK